MGKGSLDRLVSVVVLSQILQGFNSSSLWIEEQVKSLKSCDHNVGKPSDLHICEAVANVNILVANVNIFSKHNKGTKNE